MFIETFGSLAKEELLKSISSNIIPNTLVLENEDPFPGYHGDVPTEKMPESIFLVISRPLSNESVFRISHDIRKYTGLDFDACTASISIHNDQYDCIRLREIKDFESIPQIQSCFMDAGIKFLKPKRIDAKGIITVKKLFTLEKLDDNFLKDIKGDVYYLKINRQLNWNYFKKLTNQVKNNLEFSNFDAALAVIYTRNVMDVVRIYGENITLEKLKAIRSKYYEFLAKVE